MVAEAQQLRTRLVQCGGRELKQAAQSLAVAVGHSINSDEAADVIAQAAACAAPILAATPTTFAGRLDAFGEHFAQWEQASLREAQLLRTEYPVLVASPTDHRHHYEHFLRTYAAASRK